MLSARRRRKANDRQPGTGKSGLMATPGALISSIIARLSDYTAFRENLGATSTADPSRESKDCGANTRAEHRRRA